MRDLKDTVCDWPIVWQESCHKMNNYLTGESEEERLRREQLQERHYKILYDLQEMASELPIQYQQRLPYEVYFSTKHTHMISNDASYD